MRGRSRSQESGLLERTSSSRSRGSPATWAGRSPRGRDRERIRQSQSGGRSLSMGNDIPSVSYNESGEKGDGEWTFEDAIVCSLNYNVSISVLIFPYNFEVEGIVAGLIMLVLCSTVSLLTALMIGKMMDHDKSIRSYAEIAKRAAEVAFPESEIISGIASSITRVFQLMELFCYLIFTLKTVQESLEALKSPHHASMLASFGLVGLTLVFLQPRALAVMSSVGNICFTAVFGFLFVNGVANLPGKPTWAPTGSSLDLLNSFAGIMLLFSGHAVYPSIHQGLEKKKQYNLVVYFTFAALITLLLVFGGVLLFSFGDENTDLPTGTLIGHPETNLAGQVLLMIKVLSVYPILLHPIVTEALEIWRLTPSLNNCCKKSYAIGILRREGDEVYIRMHSSEEDDNDEDEDEEDFEGFPPLDYSPFLWSVRTKEAPAVLDSVDLARQKSLALVITIGSCLASMIVPDLAFVMSFVGSLFACTLAMTFPSLFYLMMFKHETWCDIFKIAAPGIFIFGLFSSLITAYSTFAS